MKGLSAAESMQAFYDNGLFDLRLRERSRDLGWLRSSLTLDAALLGPQGDGLNKKVYLRQGTPERLGRGVDMLWTPRTAEIFPEVIGVEFVIDSMTYDSLCRERFFQADYGGAGRLEIRIERS